MNLRAILTIAVSSFLILFYQNCGSDAQSLRGISNSPSSTENPIDEDTGSNSGGTPPAGGTTSGATSGGTTNGGTTGGGTTSGGSATGSSGSTSGGSNSGAATTGGGSSTGGSTSGGTTTSPVFPSQLNFNFRRDDRILMPINALQPLPYDVTGEFTVLSIVSSDLYRIRKYLGNSIDIGTKIPIIARRGETGFSLTLNHVSSEYLRDRAIITMMSQATPNVLPQQITITIEPRDSDIVDAFEGIYTGGPVRKTYDGRLFSSRTGATNLATQGKIHFNGGIHTSFAQELPDGRTFLTTIADSSTIPSAQYLSRGVYINERISYFSAMNSMEIAAISANKNNFYVGGATGTNSDYLSLTTPYTSSVGPLKSIFHSTEDRRTWLLTESGQVFAQSYTYNTTTRRLNYAAPVEINYGASIVKAVMSRDFNGLNQIVFISSNGRLYTQRTNTITPTSLVTDLSSEPGTIDEINVGSVDAQTPIYLRYSTGRRLSLIVNSSTGAIISRASAIHNPDYIMYGRPWNNTYYLLDHRTGAAITSPAR